MFKAQISAASQLLARKHMSNVAGRQHFHVQQENRYVSDKFRHDLLCIFVVQHPHTSVTRTLSTVIELHRDQVYWSRLAPWRKNSEGSQWGLQISSAFSVNIVLKCACDGVLENWSFKKANTAVTELSHPLDIDLENQHAVNSSVSLSYFTETHSSSDRYLPSTVTEILNTSVAFMQLWTTIFFKALHFSNLWHTVLYTCKHHNVAKVSKIMKCQFVNKINMPVTYGQWIAQTKHGHYSPFSKNNHNYYIA